MLVSHELLEAGMAILKDIKPTPARTLTMSPNESLAMTLLALVFPALLSSLLFNGPALPALSAISLAIAGCGVLLAWAWAINPDRAQITLWDVSGLYAFLGFAAGMLSQA